MKDMHSGVSALPLLGAAVLAASASSGWIDLQGYGAAEVLLDIGVGGIAFTDTNKIEFKVEHADADDQSDAATVTDVDLLGVSDTTDGIVKALTAAHAAATVSRFGYRGGKRYIRLTATFSGAHATGTPIAALLLKSHGFNQPESDQA